MNVGPFYDGELELAGATFVEIVDLPKGCEMYELGDRQRCRFRLPL